MTLLTDAIRAMVGTERTYIAPEPFGTASGRYFALAVEDQQPNVCSSRNSATYFNLRYQSICQFAHE